MILLTVKNEDVLRASKEILGHIKILTNTVISCDTETYPVKFLVEV